MFKKTLYAKMGDEVRIVQYDGSPNVVLELAEDAGDGQIVYVVLTQKASRKVRKALKKAERRAKVSIR